MCVDAILQNESKPSRTLDFSVTNPVQHQKRSSAHFLRYIIPATRPCFSLLLDSRPLSSSTVYPPGLIKPSQPPPLLAPQLHHELIRPCRLGPFLFPKFARGYLFSHRTVCVCSGAPLCRVLTQSFQKRRLLGRKCFTDHVRTFMLIAHM